MAKPAQLKLRLFGVPFEGSYWVVSLGPIYNGYYDWAIISDNLSFTLFVLVRDIDRFKSMYIDVIHAELKRLGFWSIEPIYQGDDCIYE